MRRIALISLGVFCVWLAGCVGEAGPVETPDNPATAGAETSESSASSDNPASDAQRIRAQLGVGTSDQGLRIDERPPPLPYVQPETPPTPSDGK